MLFDGFGNQAVPRRIGVDPVFAKEARIVLPLQKDRRDIDHRHLGFDGQLKDLNIVPLVPVGNILLIPAHPLHDILRRKASGNVFEIARGIDRRQRQKHWCAAEFFDLVNDVRIGRRKVTDGTHGQVFSVRIIGDFFPVKITIVSAEFQDDVLAVRRLNEVQVPFENAFSLDDSTAESSFILDADPERFFADFLE